MSIGDYFLLYFSFGWFNLLAFVCNYLACSSIVIEKKTMTSFDNTHLLISYSFTFLEQEKKKSLVEVQKVLVAALLICSLKMGFYLFFHANNWDLNSLQDR